MQQKGLYEYKTFIWILYCTDVAKSPKVIEKLMFTLNCEKQENGPMKGNFDKNRESRFLIALF